MQTLANKGRLSGFGTSAAASKGKAGAGGSKGKGQAKGRARAEAEGEGEEGLPPESANEEIGGGVEAGDELHEEPDEEEQE